MRMIWDLGAHNGSNIEYYLKKADCVVAVEANPRLCQQIQWRYSREIAAGTVIVENVVLIETDTPDYVDFWVHRENDVLSQVLRPSDETAFERVRLPAKSIRQLHRQHGTPFFVKFDLEQYDEFALRAMFLQEIFPEYVSVEAHSVEVFGTLLALGRYSSFKLVDGASVSSVYRKTLLTKRNGEKERYSFPSHSAGPFGDDVHGSWMSPNAFVRVLGAVGLGWKDIHASKIDPATTTSLRGTKFVFHVLYLRLQIVRARLSRKLFRLRLKLLGGRNQSEVETRHRRGSSIE